MTNRITKKDGQKGKGNNMYLYAMQSFGYGVAAFLVAGTVFLVCTAIKTMVKKWMRKQNKT